MTWHLKGGVMGVDGIISKVGEGVGIAWWSCFNV